MQPCTHISKSSSLRPPSSVSLLTEQLKSSTLNENNSLGGSVWWPQVQTDGTLSEARNPTSCDVHSTDEAPNRSRELGTDRCAICSCTGQTRMCDSNSTKSDAANINSNITRSVCTSQSQMFSSSPYAPSSFSSQGQSELEEEEIESTWRFNCTHAEATFNMIHYFSTSAPTTEAAYNPTSTSTSRSLLTFSTACTTASHAPSFTVSPSDQNSTVSDKSIHWAASTLCTCHTHLLPAKRACRSLSASASAQQSQNHSYCQHRSHLMSHGLAQTQSQRNSQLIDAHLFELHLSTLPRPIAIRLTPNSGDKSNADQTVNPVKAMSNGVLLRTSKHREYTYGSRLSWHHPLFSSGIGSRAQHPSYGVHFTCLTHPSTSVMRASGLPADMIHQSCNAESCKIPSFPRSYHAKLTETTLVPQTGLCIHCAAPSSGICHHSAFTPTHMRSSISNPPVQSSGCSLSPDADSSTASSMQIPLLTPSSGFYEASFSCLSEASSLPDCSKMMESRPELPASVVNAKSSRIVDTPSFTCQDPDSSCTEKIERTHPTESVVRCRSQPSEVPTAPTQGQSQNYNELNVAWTTPAVSGPPTTTIGSKRRRGPSMDTFDSLDVTTAGAFEPGDTIWCLSGTGETNRGNGLDHSPHPNDSTLVRQSRGSIHSSFGSWCSSASGISPSRVAFPLDGLGGPGVGDIFVFGSSTRLEKEPDSDYVNTIRRGLPDLETCQCNCHSYPLCVHNRILNSTNKPPEEGICTKETISMCVDEDVACCRNSIWHPSKTCSRTHSTICCDNSCRTYGFSQLTELSESVEEEAPDTMVAEEADDPTDPRWKRSTQSVNIKSPSVHEVTFAPIQPDDSVDMSSPYPYLSTNSLAQMPADSCYPERSHPDLLLSGGAGGELVLSLSPSDSDSSGNPDMLSPQLINRDKDKSHSNLSGLCSVNKMLNLSCVELDLNLIEND